MQVHSSEWQAKVMLYKKSQAPRPDGAKIFLNSHIIPPQYYVPPPGFSDLATALRYILQPHTQKLYQMRLTNACNQINIGALQGFQRDRTVQLFGTKGQKFLCCPGTKGQRDKLKILPQDGTGRDSQSKSGTGRGTGQGFDILPRDGQDGILTACPGISRDNHGTERKKE